MAPPAPPPPPGTQNRNSPPLDDTQDAVLGNVLASWESGKKEEAVEQLLSIRWDEPEVFANMPLMKLSEEALRGLPAGERKRIIEELIELVGTLRGVVRHAWSVGEKAQASGDKRTAKAHYEAVLHLGQALSSPERVLLIQQLGKAMMIGAQERLSAVK